MKFNYARPTLVFLMLSFWIGVVGMYFSQYLMAESKASPIALVIVFFVVTVLAIATYRMLTRTRFCLEGNELTEFDGNGKFLSKILIDDTTQISLKSDPNFRKRTLCEVQKGNDFITATSDMDRWDLFVAELRKVREFSD